MMVKPTRLVDDKIDTFALRKNYYEYFERLYKISQVVRKLTNSTATAKHLNILDFGCGSGRLLNDLYYIFPTIKYTGYDIDTDRIRECRKKNSEKILFTSDELLVKNDKKYDLIILNTVLSSMPLETLESSISTIKSALSDDGLILVYDDKILFKNSRKLRSIKRDFLKSAFPEFDMRVRSEVPLLVRAFGKYTNNQTIHSLLGLIPIYTHFMAEMRKK